MLQSQLYNLSIWLQQISPNKQKTNKQEDWNYYHNYYHYPQTYLFGGSRIYKDQKNADYNFLCLERELEAKMSSSGDLF